MSAIAMEQETRFSEYPQEMDDYFANNPIEIPLIPNKFISTINKKSPIIVSSANEFIDLIDKELAFWNENDSTGKLKEFTHIDSLKKAKAEFENSKKYFANPSLDRQAKTYLNNSIAAVNQGILYSKSSFAKYLLEFNNESTEFLRGFRCGLLKNKTSTFHNTVADIEGITVALRYRKIIDDFSSPTQEEIEKYTTSVNQANENFSKLNSNYTTSFHQHEERIALINTQMNAHIQEMSEKSNAYFAEKDKRCAELEALYEEKLKLEAPADYWDKMEKEYRKSGTVWMVFSVIWTVLIIVALISTLAFLPNLFTKNSHWIDVFKNSAIITVVTSIAVYILRIFIKMAMSSFHLSRDAKERNKLTYFYLALIEKNGVTDKERAIILNSLFSRADTGLLKGDSAPSMSANVSDLVQTLTNKNGS